MTSLEIVLIVICVILLICVIILSVLNRKIHKDVDGLTDSIDNFIENNVPTDFSTSDNHFSRLQNSVSDLENLYRLEQSNTLKETKKNTEFISDVSHQLKTPLAGLRLYAELENNENPSEHTEKELLLIEKMENLIFKLLRLEKIKSDSYSMDFKPYEIRNIADEIVDEFRPLFEQKHYIVSGSSIMRCDKEWLFEALGNLVKNASEHTADDGTVEIVIENSEKSTIVTVADNGGGISENELPMIFSRFHRTSNAKPNSAGIGLAITKAIVEKHHGTISAENKDNGLSIIICFPHIDGYITI
ncbi:MAG: sensor histidine kinase [Eubacterium sp.]